VVEADVITPAAQAMFAALVRELTGATPGDARIIAQVMRERHALDTLAASADAAFAVGRGRILPTRDQARIGRAIDTTDPVLMALVEELMRSDHGPLDGIDPLVFDTAARQARAKANMMSRDRQLRPWCRVNGIAIPAQYQG
jgi:hypothetical protein